MSNIDPTVPTYGAATTQSVRNNFGIAKTEIEAHQAAFDALPFASDGTIDGPLIYTATGGTVARSAQDRAADLVNVKDLGAKGDGVTDDAAAIRAAVAKGGDIWFPEGVYLTSGAVIVIPNNTRLRGAGSARTVIKTGALTVRTWDGQPAPRDGDTRTWSVPTAFCNALYLNPGPFSAGSTTPALQTDHDITIEDMGFDCVTSGGEIATLRFMLARRLRFHGLRFFNSAPAPTWGGGGIGIVGCDTVTFTECDFPASMNPIDCWQGCTRVKVSRCFIGAYDYGNVVNGGLINWNGGGTVTPQTQSSNDLQVSDCTFWLRNTIAILLDSFTSGCSSHTHDIAGCRFHVKAGTGNNQGIVGRGYGGNTKISNCTFSADPGMTMSTPINLSGFYSGMAPVVGSGIVSTTSGSPNFTVSLPGGTDLGPGNFCSIDNNASGPIAGNGMSLLGWYKVLSVSGATSSTTTGTLLTCLGPNSATATGPIAGATRQLGYFGSFANCQLSNLTFDGVGYAGNYLVNVCGSGHRVNGITVTGNYYLGSPQYLAIIQYDTTQDLGNPAPSRVELNNVLGAAGTGALPGGWAGDNRIAWQPYSTLADMPVWDLSGNGGITIGGMAWGSGSPRPAPPAQGLLSTGPIQIGSVTGPTWTTGSAVPSSVQPVGSLYSRVSAWAAGATLYVSKGGGAWTAVAGV